MQHPILQVLRIGVNRRNKLRHQEVRLQHINMEEHGILNFEVMSALAKMNRKKEAGPDRIIIQILSTFGDFTINKIT